MNATAIVLLIIGGLFFAISFFLPEGIGTKKEEPAFDEEELRKMVDEEVQKARERIEDIVNETIDYSIEATERKIDKISIDKINEVDEYSQTVLKKINDNHQEAVFLYDMLNDKDEKLKNTGEEIKATTEALKSKAEELKAKEEVIEEVIENIGNAEKIEKIVEPEPVKEEAPAFVPFIPKHYEIKDGEVVPAGQSDSAPEADETVKEKEKPKAKPAKKSTARASKKPAAPVDAPEDQPVFTTDLDGKKNSNELIKRLHEEGKTNMQIAKELGLGVGEVKLVIDLFSSKRG